MAADQQILEHYPRLAGKTVLITGASSGIGEACARHFAHCGSNLVLFARREERLEALSTELRTAHPALQVWYARVDVRDFEAVKEAVSKVPENLKAFDIVINNAGLARGVATTADNTLEDIDLVLDTNVKGVLYVLKAVLPAMKKQVAGGTIINVSSIAGVEAYRNGSIYCASKHAVHALTISLRKEVAQYPIRVALVSPGLVETEFSLVRFDDKTKADAVYSDLTPLKGEDVADSIVFMASRPSHVQIADLLLLPTCQASTEVIHRGPFITDN